jgi:hypothetical protein
MLSVVPQLHAGEAEADLASFRDFKMPFGEHYVTDRKPAYDLGLTRTSRSGFNTTPPDNKRPPLLSLQFKGEELHAINLNGFNVLEKRVSYAPNGSETTVFKVNWKYVAASALVIEGVAWTSQENDWDVFGHDGDEDNPPPPPTPAPA